MGPEDPPSPRITVYLNTTKMSFPGEKVALKGGPAEVPQSPQAPPPDL